MPRLEPGLKKQVKKRTPRKVVLRISKTAPLGAIPIPARKTEASIPASVPSPVKNESRSRSSGVGLDGAYLRRLASLIESEKRYPGESLRNSEEGLVKLKVRISPRGEILGVLLQGSSGFKRLDRAALDALNAIKRLPAPPGATGDLSLLVPIRFEILSST